MADGLACPTASWRVRLVLLRGAGSSLRKQPPGRENGRSLLPPLAAAAALPQSLPLASHPTLLTNLSTATLVEWARSTAAHASGEDALVASWLAASATRATEPRAAATAVQVP